MLLYLFRSLDEINGEHEDFITNHFLEPDKKLDLHMSRITRTCNMGLHVFVGCLVFSRSDCVTKNTEVGMHEPRGWMRCRQMWGEYTLVLRKMSGRGLWYSSAWI
jgi:hypothetical protein